jgi:hypothetical protein
MAVLSGDTAVFEMPYKSVIKRHKGIYPTVRLRETFAGSPMLPRASKQVNFHCRVICIFPMVDNNEE